MPFHETETPDFDRVLSVKLWGYLVCARETIKHQLAQNRQGVTINISSVHEIINYAGTFKEITAAVAFLASDEAAYITGQTLFVNDELTLYTDFHEAWSA